MATCSGLFKQNWLIFIRGICGTGLLALRRFDIAQQSRGGSAVEVLLERLQARGHGRKFEMVMGKARVRMGIVDGIEHVTDGNVGAVAGRLQLGSAKDKS